MNRQQKIKEKQKKEDLVKAFEKIELKLRIRSKRWHQRFTWKRKNDETQRESAKNTDEEADWKYFMRKSKQHADMAEKLKPDKFSWSMRKTGNTWNCLDKRIKRDESEEN